jgi:hypothetical protein
MSDNDVVKGIRARHKSATPKPGINPAWANAEVDIGLLLKEYDWMRLDRDSHQRVAMRAMERADKLAAKKISESLSDDVGTSGGDPTENGENGRTCSQAQRASES